MTMPSLIRCANCGREIEVHNCIGKPKKNEWKRLAMEAMRYLDADQIAAATKAAGAQSFICNPASASLLDTPE